MAKLDGFPLKLAIDGSSCSHNLKGVGMGWFYFSLTFTRQHVKSPPIEFFGKANF